MKLSRKDSLGDPGSCTYLSPHPTAGSQTQVGVWSPLSAPGTPQDTTPRSDLPRSPTPTSGLFLALDSLQVGFSHEKPVPGLSGHSAETGDGRGMSSQEGTRCAGRSFSPTRRLPGLQQPASRCLSTAGCRPYYTCSSPTPRAHVPRAQGHSLPGSHRSSLQPPLQTVRRRSGPEQE